MKRKPDFFVTLVAILGIGVMISGFAKWGGQPQQPAQIQQVSDPEIKSNWLLTGVKPPRQ